jgi:signal recognition particle receptor subunit beta
VTNYWGKEIQRIFFVTVTRTATMLILANKRDLKEKMSMEEISAGLKLEELKIDWNLKECNATKGSGLHKGFEWLYNNIMKNKRNVT